MDKWFGVGTGTQPMLGLSHSEKNHLLFLSQKQTLDLFLERSTITRAQYEKSLRDLQAKMSEMEEEAQ